MRRLRRAVLAAALAAIVFGLLVLSPAPVASGAASGSQVTVCDYDHLIAAIDAANGDTVTFACSGTITVSPPITVASGQQVSLDSTGQAVVLRGSSDRIFDVEGGTLVLAGASGGKLVLSGGSHTGSPALGGAIFIASESTAELSYVSVEDSLAVGEAGDDYQPGGGASGGAIYNDGSLTVSHSLFARNGAVAGGSSLEGVGGDASGGAIFNDGSLELGADVSFSDDHASGGRGGFGGNGADNEGVGGVDEDVSYIKGGPGGTGGAGGSAFGGAIFNGGTLTAISTPVFSSNSAVGGAGGNGGSGGKGPDAGGCVSGALGAIGGDGGDGGFGGDGGDATGGALYTTGDPIGATYSGNTVDGEIGGDGGPGGAGGAAGSVPDPRGTCSPPSPGDDGQQGGNGQYGAFQEPDMYANCSPSCDAAPPVTTSTLSPTSPTGSNGWYTAPVHVTLSATDGGSGVAETRCVVNPAVLPSVFEDIPTGCAFTGAGRDFARGQHTVFFASGDNQGNKESVRSAAIKIDRRPPTVSLTPTGTLGSNGWFLSSVNVHTSGTDPGSGVSSCTSDQTLTNETAGMVVNGSCTDNAGLVGNAPPLVIGIDKTAPTVAVTISPAGPNGLDGWYRQGPRFLVTGTDSISGTAEIRCVLDPANAPASFADMPPGCPYLTSTQLSTDGSHTLYAASKDRAGRLSAVKQVSWKFDHTPPTMGCAVTPKPLTPTDHRMVNIAANVGVTDALSGVKDFWLVSVSSNQPDSGLGPDDLPNDIQGFTFGTVDLAGQLRAEAYAGTRSYTLKYQAQDHAGNTAYCTPKDNVPLG